MGTRVLCPGCAFGFWYTWGALAKYSRQNTFYTISASSIAVAFYLCRINVKDQIELCAKLRPHAFRRPYRTLRRWLNASLPHNSHTICRGRLKIMTRRLPFLKVEVHDQWTSKQHLIQNLIASCSVVSPYFVSHADGKSGWYTDCLRATISDAVYLNTKLVMYPPTKSGAAQLFNNGLRHHH